MLNIPYIKPILIGVLLAAWAGSMWYAREDGKEAVQALWDANKAEVIAAQLADEQAKRIQTEERIKIAEQVAKNAQQEIDAIQPKLDTANDLARRLRATDTITRAALKRCTDSTASSPGTAAAPTEGMSTDELLGRIDILEERLADLTTATAEHSSKARIAGLACVQQYEKIRATQK